MYIITVPGSVEVFSDFGSTSDAVAGVSQEVFCASWKISASSCKFIHDFLKEVDQRKEETQKQFNLNYMGQLWL